MKRTYHRSIFAPLLLGLATISALSGCGNLSLPCLLGLPSCTSNSTNSSNNDTSRPAGTDFANAPVLPLDASGNATFTGTISNGEVDVYDLGAFAAGDRVVVTVDPAANSLLDPTAAIFNSSGELFSINDDFNFDAGDISSHMDEIISVADQHYYLAISKYYSDANGGAYSASVQTERGGTFPQPAVQYLVLDFDGGTLTLPSEGTLTLTPFDAADVDPAYAGKTAQIKAKIVETVRQNYRNTGVVISTSDDPLPAANTYSSVFFGGYSSTKFGVAQDVDQSNRNVCDDGIVFTDDFDKPFATQPSADGLAIAIGNVAAHEAGHLLGLNHVSDITDLMDNTGTASTLLADQEFKTATLSPSVFPIGRQNGPAMLERVVPK